MIEADDSKAWIGDRALLMETAQQLGWVKAVRSHDDNLDSTAGPRPQPPGSSPQTVALAIPLAAEAHQQRQRHVFWPRLFPITE
ncbi:MAG: hypothetical protein ACPGVO_08100 [Spirulinaceae cyanobacterium]